MGTSAYLTLQAVPLLLTPRLIVSMLAPEPRRMTDLEAYLSRSFAMLLLAFAALNLLQTGAIPLTNSVAESMTAAPDKEGLRRNPYAYPTAVITTGYHAISAMYIYMQIAQRISFAFAIGLICSSALFCVGVWVLLFGGDIRKTSKTTGADKRTSNYPFDNKESARHMKKEEKDKSKRRSILRSNSSRG